MIAGVALIVTLYFMCGAVFFGLEASVARSIESRRAFLVVTVLMSLPVLVVPWAVLS